MGSLPADEKFALISCALAGFVLYEQTSGVLLLGVDSSEPAGPTVGSSIVDFNLFLCVSV